MLLALGACSDTGSDGASSPPSDRGAPSATTPVPPEPTASAPAPQLIAYAGGEAAGVRIQNRSDADALRGAPVEFRGFIGRTAQALVDEAACDEAYVGVTVDAVRTDGYAVGGVDECGGYAALWALVDGSWQEIAGTQDSWDCAVLKRYRVPSDLLLGDQTCFDYDGDHAEHDYHQA